MNLTSLIGGMHAIMPDTRTVQYRPQVEGEYPAGQTVPRAEKRPQDVTPVDYGIIGFETEGIVWHLWAECLGDAEPRPNGKIIDGDQEWYIRTVRAELLGQRFRCLCTRRPGT